MIQEDGYYPFGMVAQGSSLPRRPPAGRAGQAGLKAQRGIQNDYLYNGKELQEELGLDTYAYEFRMYDPTLGRWWQQDPKIKENFSPYAWVTNNPILFFDFLGLDSLDAIALTAAAEASVQKITDDYGTSSPQCNRGVAQAFEELTGSEELNNLSANDMYDFINDSDDFEEVEQDEIQALANDGKIVIAAKKATNHGHIVLGVPGEEAYSGSWEQEVPQVMDTGNNRRESKQKISNSWTSTDKDSITYFRYLGDTYTSKIYAGRALPEIVISGKRSTAPVPELKPLFNASF